MQAVTPGPIWLTLGTQSVRPDIVFVFAIRNPGHDPKSRDCFELLDDIVPNALGSLF